jgi:hypothetical protein
MQHHFVVVYDTELKEWSVEGDPDFFPDGSIYSREYANDPERGFFGWLSPEENSLEETLDLELYRTLGYIVDTFPVPQDA